MKKLFLISSIMSSFIFISCDDINKKVDELQEKTKSLDSMINSEIDKVKTLDSIIEKEKTKIQEMDSLIQNTGKKLEPILGN